MCNTAKADFLANQADFHGGSFKKLLCLFDPDTVQILHERKPCRFFKNDLNNKGWHKISLPADEAITPAYSNCWYNGQPPRFFHAWSLEIPSFLCCFYDMPAANHEHLQHQSLCIHLEAHLLLLHLLPDTLPKRLDGKLIKQRTFHNEILIFKHRLQNVFIRSIYRGYIVLMNIHDEPFMFRHFRIGCPVQNIRRDNDDIPSLITIVLSLIKNSRLPDIK